MTDSEVQFRRLVDGLPAGAYTCTFSGRITYFNKQAEQMWGRRPDPEDFWSGALKLYTSEGTPIAHNDCLVAQALKDGKEYIGRECIIERPDGSRLFVLENVTPLSNESQQQIGAMNVLMDISDRKRSEEFLRQADEHKDNFLAILAHELLNPLAPMRSAVHILQSDKASREMRMGATDILDRQIDQMVRLVSDLLDASRIKGGKIELRRERVKLRDIIQHAIETSRPLIDERQHTLAVELPDSYIFAEVDSDRLSQVVSNLLNNAAKYTDKGGHIRVMLERNGDRGIIRISDTGIGISDEMKPRIFDMFSQVESSLNRAEGGLGIGLSLVRELVQMHGGSVEIQSEGLNKGSEFIVTLPVLGSDEPAQRKTLASEQPVVPATSLRVLMVDDNAAYAKLMGYTLELLGHEVRLAHNAADAIAIAKIYQPDVAMLDIGMPGTDGYQLCQIMRREAVCDKTIFIAQTGWGHVEHRKRSDQAGFDFHLVKPVQMETLEKLFSTFDPKIFKSREARHIREAI